MSRLDKYLWSIRIYKTRADATEACKAGRIKVNDVDGKASREVRSNDIITIRKANIHFKYKVLVPIDKRQPAKLVESFAQNITPQEELDKLNAPRETIFLVRDRGTGRPTKRDRRDMDELLDNLDSFSVETEEND